MVTNNKLYVERNNFLKYNRKTSKARLGKARLSKVHLRDSLCVLIDKSSSE